MKEIGGAGNIQPSFVAHAISQLKKKMSRENLKKEMYI